MSARLEIADETVTGEILHSMTLMLQSAKVTARAIIEERVRDEVARFNARPEETRFMGLVEPTEAEAELNGYRLRKPRHLDADAQVAQALHAFERNGFFMLAHGRQIQSLDEEIPLLEPLRVAFVKLVPLVGG